MNAQLSWNLVEDVRQMLAYPFMVNALRAGTIVAVVAGAVGYLMVLRRESFAGHTLAVIGFPGAAGATWLGLNPVFGFFGFCVAGAAVIAGLSPARRGVRAPGQRSALIGTVQAFALACGLLFAALYHGFLNGITDLLFGSIVAVTTTQVLLLLIAGGVSLLLLAVLGRPLLFATLDPQTAQARGVPVRAVGAAYLVLLGVAAAGASQVTGSLLVFALLVAPAAAAARLTSRPATGLAVSVLVAVAVTWLGETAAYYYPSTPIGFWVTTFAFAVFLASVGYRTARDRRAGRSSADFGGVSRRTGRSR
jgi:zinc/manganese transport system permease protein